jgi:putative acetyltransferase
MIEHLLAMARRDRYRQVSLETGTTRDFAAARALYEKVGFQAAEAFGDYHESPHNTFMTIYLD